MDLIDEIRTGSFHNSRVMRDAFKNFCLRHALLPEEVGIGKMSRTMDYKVDFPTKKEMTKLARKTFGTPKYLRRKYRKQILGKLGYPS